MANSKENSSRDKQAEIFESIRTRVKNLLKQYGEPDTALSDGDYTVQGDYLDASEVVVFVGNLEMLAPNIIDGLHAVIKAFAGWQIVMTVAVRGHYHDWPNMGLYIRPHEIIDALQRQFLPKEVQELEYPGARRGTAYD